MKKRSLLLAAIMLCSLAFVTFVHKSQAQGPADKLELISKALNLTPQQKTQLLPILKAEAPKLEEIKNNPTMPPAQKLKGLKAIHSQSDPKVKSILSAQQYGKWQQIRQQEIEEAIQKRK